MKKNISGLVLGPVGTQISSGPDGPDAITAPVMESQAQNIRRKRYSAECNRNIIT